MSFDQDFVTDLYALYLRFAVEARQITCCECSELQQLKMFSGFEIADLKEIRKVLLVSN